MEGVRLVYGKVGVYAVGRSGCGERWSKDGIVAGGVKESRQCFW